MPLFNTSLITLIAIVLVAGCTTINTQTPDREAPVLLVSVLNNPQGSGSVLIASSNTANRPTSLGCPVGTPLAGDFPYSYIMNLNNTVRFNVTSNDQGGVNKLTVKIRPVKLSQVSGVSVATDPGATTNVTQSAPLTVKIESDFNNLRTAQILRFDVSDLDRVVVLPGVSSVDFNNNTASIPDSSLGLVQAQVNDSVVCN